MGGEQFEKVVLESTPIESRYRSTEERRCGVRVNWCDNPFLLPAPIGAPCLGMGLGLVSGRHYHE